MLTFSNANVTVRADGAAGDLIAKVISDYDSIIDSHPQVRTRGFIRDELVVTTDLAWYRDTTKNTALDSNGELLGGQMSTRVPGTYVIFINNSDDNIREGIVVHELMHLTHPGLGGGQPHQPRFYLDHAHLSDALGYPIDQWNGPSIGGLFKDGNQFARGVVKYGISGSEIDELFELRGVEGLKYLLYDVWRIAGQDRSLALLKQIYDYYELPVPEFPDVSIADRANLNFSFGYLNSDGIQDIQLNDAGGVKSYKNEAGQTVLTDPDHHYTPNLLRHYGIEERQDDGSIMGRTTFWATLKAAADGLGLDGEFGIQGAFTTHNEGTKRNGVRGDTDRDRDNGTSSTDDSNNITNYFGDRDGDGVPNVIDFNDGVGWADQDKDDEAESAPIIFDLDGNGIQITELSNSSIYMDATGDGLENRTAWAGAGDAVLFLHDPDNPGEITEMRQYVFTEWDPTAATDMEALASVFDLNGDGVLSGDELDQFRLMVTNADGSTTAMTLGQLGIVSIDLTADATNIELPDGSVITGQTTFTRDDGSTGTVADVTLIAEVDGHRLEQVETFDANGTRTEVTTGYDADGSIAFVNTTVASADGAQIANSYDDNGDGVVDRLQTIDTVTQPDGSTVKTVTNSLGAVAATAILLNETRTTTSADGNTVTIDRDSTGGGWYDQTEVRVTAADGSMTIVTSDRSPPDVGETYGDPIRTVTEDVSADGLTRTEAIDDDGDGVADLTMTHVIVVNPDGSRAETVTVLNQDGSVRSVVTETVSADGQTKTISRDVDGDGNFDTIEELDIMTGSAGSESTITVRNGDGKIRSSVEQDQSDDALTKTIRSDLDGDELFDVITVDDTVINADGSRVNTITTTNQDGSIRGMQEVTLGADQVTSETRVDLNQNGIFEATDLVRSVTVDGTTGERTAISWDSNADGSINAVSTSVTSADGLTRTTTHEVDADGDGNLGGVNDIATTITDITTVNGAGDAKRTVTTTNPDGTLRSKVVSETSADGLTTTTTVDTDGDGALDGTTNVSQTNNGDGIVTRTSSTYAGDGVTLLSESVSVESADRLVMTTTTDSNGDGSVDREVVSTQNIDGSRTVVETSFHADGTVAGTQSTEVSADGLVVTTTTDADGDGVSETISDSTTTLDVDGGRTQTSDERNNDDSLRNQTITTVSDDGLTTTSQTDSDGDGTFERTSTSVTSLNTDGSATTISQDFAADGSLISQTLADTSDDGLVVTQSKDADGDGTYDLTSTTTTTLETDGGTTTVNEVYDSVGVLRSGSTTTASDDGRHVTRSVDSNGDGSADQVSVTIEADNGALRSTTSQLGADGSVQSASETVVSANGLETTVSEDRDGDGITDMVMTEFTTLNDDGSTTRTTSDFGGNGAVFGASFFGGTPYSTSTTTTTADGRTSTRTNDYDADGIADLTIVSDTDLAANGTQTQTTTRSSADGSTLGVLTVETSADGRTVTTNNDTDGNGNDDLRTVSVVADDGTRTSTTEYLSTGGVVESSYQVITSGDGLTTTRLTDRNGDGEIDLRTVETSAIATDGTVTRTVEHRGQHHVLEGREEYVVSNYGMSSTSSLDIDGDGLFDFITDVETTYASNGDVIHHEETRDITSDILSDITTTTSGDGLTTDVVADYSGDGSVDRTTSIVRGPDGGFTSLVQHYGAGYDPQRTETQTVSADGRTSTQTIDLDGDGFVDQQVSAVIDLSGNTTTTYANLQINGAVTSTITGFEAANGMHMSYSFDVDGDGTTDITRTTDIEYEADGDMVRTFTGTYGTTTVYEETTTTAADGLSSTGTFDIDGDGDIDGTTSSVTTLNADGSRATVTETHYADGELHSSVVETVSADGRTTTREMDYDGNGIADKVSETVIASDGSRINTETSFNEVGIRGNTFTTTTSADGLTTTVMRQGNVQTTTRSVLDNGSYEWDNGVTAGTAGHLSTSHEIDALGVETWSLLVGSSQYEVRLDAAAKERLFNEAESIFDTVVDRGLDTNEREQLIRWMADGELDKVALIDELMTSGEYITRYGTMTDAEFVSQTYMNTFGRAPSMTELAEHLYALDVSFRTRAEIALELADSVEHGVVGNGHMLTNNFDVIMNPAVFERSLDEAYVASVITNLVDVVYDRAPTAQELAYLSELLLEGDELPDDIATILLGLDGEIEGVPSNSLNGLAGAALVEQAFMNALGRAPSQAELDLWTGNLTAGTITIAQFVASLAQSTEHLEAGNGHVVTGVPSVNTIVGTSTPSTGNGNDNGGGETLNGGAGIDHFKGGTGDDTFKGGDGNDIYEWAKGDGNDTIDDDGDHLTETDTLRLTDVDPDDVILTRADGTSDVVVTIISTGEEITLDAQYSNTYPGRGIESIEFADGTIWDLADIRAATTVSGNSGNNTVDGKDYDDNLFGLEGNDTLNGNAGDDVLDGGTGDDTLNGGEGSDTYVWEVGDGNDTISELTLTEGGIDVLILEGVNVADVTLTRDRGVADVQDDLQITISGPGGDETIEVLGQFDGNTAAGIEQIVFADGTVWDRDDIITNTTLDGTDGNNTVDGLAGHDVIHGHDGNDTLSGLAGDDWLHGGLGNDTLKGGLGGDTYVWSVGDGDDLINEEYNTDATQLDHLIFTDVDSTDVVLERENSLDGELRNDLLIVINGTETIEVFDQFKTNGEGLEHITFADGVVWTREDIITRTRLEGTNGNDTGLTELNGSSVRDNLFGLAGDDTIDAGAGDDWLYGGLDDDTLLGDGGNDTYVYAEGDGNDEIRDTGATDAETDTLVLTDINADEATLAKSDNGMDLIVTITATEETITVTDRFDAGTHGTGDGIEFITFADGVIVEVLGGALAETIATGTEAANTLNGWGLEDTIYGLGGNDTIDGNGGDDTLIGGAGDDYLKGDTGNDTYIWSAGDGNDTIYDSAQSLTEIDRLELTDINADGVSLTRPEGSNDLLITIVSTGEVLIVEDRYRDGTNGRGIEEILFADGTVWTLDDIRANTITEDTVGGTVVEGTAYADNLYGLDGNDTIEGFAGDDHLIGGVGDDKLKGGVGNDTYVWSTGDGNDIINDKDVLSPDTDTLVLTDVNADGVELFIEGGSNDQLNDLHIRIVATGEVIEVWDQFDDQYEGIEAIEFADGVTWTLEDIIANTSLTGTASADSLDGLDVRDNIYGLGGDDDLEGHGGDDHIHGGDGNDIIDGDDGNDSLFGGDGDDELIGGAGADLLYGGAGNDLLRGDGDADHFDGGDGVDTVDFSYSTGEITVNLATGQIDWPATGGIETIVNVENVIGSSGDNIIIGDSADNHLDGANGEDTLRGGAGNDVLEGGNGRDSFIFATGDGADIIADFDVAEDDITLNGVMVFPPSLGSGVTAIQQGNDVLISYGAGDTITLSDVDLADWTTASTATIDGTNSANTIDRDFVDGQGNMVHDGGQTILGKDGEDLIHAGAGDDLIYGGSHYDTIYAGAGNDQVWGDNGRDTIWLEAGDDIFYDNTQSNSNAHDTVYGGDGNDTFNGGGGNDIFAGDAGDDTLSGGIGNDTLTGGTDTDTFVFSLGDGSDVITDFENGIDILDFTSTGLTFGDLTITTDASGSTIVTYGSGDQIELLNTSGQIDQSDFIFV